MRAIAVFVACACMRAQDLDTVMGKNNRKPATILDEVKRPAERQAFLDLRDPGDPDRMCLQCHDASLAGTKARQA